MNVGCEIVKDVLPLYHDGVCSEETKKAVEEHLDSCEECRAEYKLICGTEYMEKALYDPARSKELAESYKRVKRRSDRRTILTIALAVIGAALIVIGFIKYYTAVYAARNGRAFLNDPPAVGARADGQKELILYID